MFCHSIYSNRYKVTSEHAIIWPSIYVFTLFYRVNGLGKIVNKLLIQSVCLVSIVLLVGCAWVKLSPGAEDVRVLNDDEVSQCQSLGKTTVSLKAEILGIKRNREKTRFELETLARNSALNLKGNSIVVDSDIENGQRAYRIYHCQ